MNLIAWDKYTKLFFNQQKTPKQIGDKYKANLLIELVENGVEANMTKTSIRKENETIYIGDGGIDIFGNYLNMNYIMQAKYRTDDGAYVSPKDVREFAAVLMQQPEDIVGFFVSNAKCSKRTQNYANNSKVRIILCDEKNLVEKIKEAQQRFEVKDMQDICVKDISTEEGVCTEIYIIKFNSKIRIGCIYSKKIRNSVNYIEFIFFYWSVQWYSTKQIYLVVKSNKKKCLNHLII